MVARNFILMLSSNAPKFKGDAHTSHWVVILKCRAHVFYMPPGATLLSKVSLCALERNVQMEMKNRMLGAGAVLETAQNVEMVRGLRPLLCRQCWSCADAHAASHH